MQNFEQLGVNPSLVALLKQNHIEEPTPIQSLAIPQLLEKKDVIGQAKTGTGKTLAYALPMFSLICWERKEVQALILCPTRELSIQVGEEIGKLCQAFSNARIACIYGGESYDKQYAALKKKPQVVIGTPGRLLDHLRKQTISLDGVGYLILDEADEMLKMGFEEDMKEILRFLPEFHQTGLFSATFPRQVQSLAQSLMNRPVRIQIASKTLTVDSIRQTYYEVLKKDKKALLLRLLYYFQFKSCIVFANTKVMVDELVTYLQGQGFGVMGLHGDLKQAERSRIMQHFKHSVATTLIATDVAARGLDITDVEAIVNYDLPLENEIYVHRIGRTGRAGKNGLSICLVSPSERRRLAEIEKFTKTKMTAFSIPSEEEIIKKQHELLYRKIVDQMDHPQQDYSDVLNRLRKKTSDPIPILNAMLVLLDQNKMELPEIEPVSSAKKTFGRWTLVEVNIGTRQGLRPNEWIRFLNEEMKIHREHFGKILIRKDKTIFELNAKGLPFLKGLEKKRFHGRKIAWKCLYEKEKMPEN